jgi:hypothetical protein
MRGNQHPNNEQRARVDLKLFWVMINLMPIVFVFLQIIMEAEYILKIFQLLAKPYSELSSAVNKLPHYGREREKVLQPLMDQILEEIQAKRYTFFRSYEGGLVGKYKPY